LFDLALYAPLALFLARGAYGGLRLYAGERRTAQLFQLFALLAIGIACLGLFGLAAFATEQRAKEIDP
jgi:hypothetical protein